MSGNADISICLTPPQLAKRWLCTPETVLSHIKAGRLRAFTLSPPDAKRPRWRISPDAITEFERLHSAHQPQQPVRRRRQAKREPQYVEYV